MPIVSPYGSPTREFPLEAIEALIGRARPGMTKAEFNALADPAASGPQTAARYLRFENNILLRDRFLSLAETEGLGSQRMRKIMYGVFVLRDDRIRNFVVNVIAGRDGRWRGAQVTRKANEAHFVFSNSLDTRTKTRSNFERFLVETGIFGGGIANLDLADGWLQDAVAIASQYETDAETRNVMLNDPIGYIIQQGWHGLANATVEELRGVAPIAQPENEVGDDADIEIAEPAAPQPQEWNRLAPQFQDRQAAVVFQNAVARERASTAHHAIEELLANAIRAAGKRPQTTVAIDLFFEARRGNVVAEVKSCHAGNIHSQIRRGVSQLLEYEHRYGNDLGRPIQKCLVLEMEPAGRRAWLIGYLSELGIFVCWRNADGNRLQSTVAIPAALAGIVHPQ